jgi:phosphomannomutase
MHLGLYAHSAVGRDLMQEIYESLGARVTRLGDSDVFIPVDTEAIRPEDVALASRWTQEHGFDAMVSTDGDSDRPLISDECGRWLRGDVAGLLCAKQLKADTVVTPVSSNSAVEACGAFARVVRTRIGSPYVIEGMNSAVAEGGRCVVGYEANGGFLTASAIKVFKGFLEPLPTRDAVIVHLAILSAARDAGCKVSKLLADLPPRFTWSDRLQAFPAEAGRGRLLALQQAGFAMIADVFRAFGSVSKVDFTDGMRVTFACGSVLHIRASGNAPELRCYTEGSTEEQARDWNRKAMQLLETWRP